MEELHGGTDRRGLLLVAGLVVALAEYSVVCRPRTPSEVGIDASGAGGFRARRVSERRPSGS